MDDDIDISYVIGFAALFQVLCKVMAALTQYFFLCAFLWMLGEGVILYVLLVRVFGNLADKWCILIPFCWGEVITKLNFNIALFILSFSWFRNNYSEFTYRNVSIFNINSILRLNSESFILLFFSFSFRPSFSKF